MRSDNLKRHMMRRDHLTEHETKDNIVTKGLHDGEIWNNSCKCEYCECELGCCGSFDKA